MRARNRNTRQNSSAKVKNWRMHPKKYRLITSRKSGIAPLPRTTCRQKLPHWKQSYEVSRAEDPDEYFFSPLFMGSITPFIVLLVIALIFSYMPMDAKLKQIGYIIIGVVAIFMLLRFAGIV